MVSPQYLHLIVTIVWEVYERLTRFQQRFWFNLPVYWNPKTKRASSRPLLKCLPILVISLLQIPIYVVSGLILYLQSTPKYADPRYPFGEAVAMAFGSVMNIFITNGSFTTLQKRKEFALTLNIVANHHFHSSKHKNFLSKWAKRKLFRNYTLPDLIVEGFSLFLLPLGLVGLVLPFIMDADPIYYFLMNLDRSSLEWYISKYCVRPIVLLLWTSYLFLVFFNGVIPMIIAIIHGCMKVPHTPMEAKCFRFSIIYNTHILGIIGYRQNLSRQLLETGYKEYRHFQVYIRIANDANYMIIPFGLSGIGLVCVAGGFITLKGFSILPLSIYVVFPLITMLALMLIFAMVPIACGVFENAMQFKFFWLGHTNQRESVRRLRGCRPMGITNGPFGYIQRSLPMELSNGIVNRICDAIVSIG